MDAARACFIRKGVHATSMQDIFAEAGLSAGAVYRYFKSKNEIIEAIADEVVGTLEAALDAPADGPPPSLLDAVEGGLRMVDRQLGADGAFRIAVLVWAEAMHDPAFADIVAARYVGLRLRLTAVARHAVATGALPPGSDPAAVASALLSLIPGYALQRTLVGTPDLDTYLSGVRALLSRP